MKLTNPEMDEHTPHDKGLRFWENPKVRGFLHRNKYACYGVLIAFLLAVMIIAVGFGYTLMMVFFLAIGWGIGAWRDRNPLLLRLLNRFL